MGVGWALVFFTEDIYAKTRTGRGISYIGLRAGTITKVLAMMMSRGTCCSSSRKGSAIYGTARYLPPSSSRRWRCRNNYSKRVQGHTTRGGNIRRVLCI